MTQTGGNLYNKDIPMEAIRTPDTHDNTPLKQQGLNKKKPLVIGGPQLGKQ
jgi:hypothetical protein